ncbi:unnamed protein product [Peniophora sp. CBMAI 1063]|nr:unnamed protein product [Peniophora sp. CBMAI 1063]
MEGYTISISTRRLIEAKHRDSVLSAAFGLHFAIKHAFDHALSVWKAETSASSDDWVNLEDFVRASYLDLSESDYTPHGLPPYAIPFFAWGTFDFDAHTFQARSASWWHLLDMAAPRPSHIIPSTLFVPYARTSVTRSENVVKGFKRTTLWFVRCDGGLGVPVEGNRPLLWHGAKEFRRERKTMKIKLSWPGYDDEWEKQIRLMSDAGDRSICRLAGLVANKVRDFVCDHDPSFGHPIGTHSRWRIGSHAGQIRAGDILLLGIALVSDGAAMPILQVRDDFVFAS